MLIRRSSSAKLICRADINAFALVMVLIVFVVLICLMTESRPFARSTIDLPRVLRPVSIGALTWGANRHDAMIIAIKRSGVFFMKNEMVPSSELAARIHQCVSEGAERTVYVAADSRARYKDVKTVLDAIQSESIADVAFFTEQRRVSQ